MEHTLVRYGGCANRGMRVIMLSMEDELEEAVSLMAEGDDAAAIELYRSVAGVDESRARDALYAALSEPGAPRMSDDVLHRYIIEMRNRSSKVSANALYCEQRDYDPREAMDVIMALSEYGCPPPDGYSYSGMGDALVKAWVMYEHGSVEKGIDLYCEMTGEDRDTAREALEEQSQDWKFRDAPPKAWS